MINRYQLITNLLKEMKLSEDKRAFLASQPDEVLLSNTGWECLRKGYYVLGAKKQVI